MPPARPSGRSALQPRANAGAAIALVLLMLTATPGLADPVAESAQAPEAPDPPETLAWSEDLDAVVRGALARSAGQVLGGWIAEELEQGAYRSLLDATPRARATLASIMQENASVEPAMTDALEGLLSAMDTGHDPRALAKAMPVGELILGLLPGAATQLLASELPASSATTPSCLDGLLSVSLPEELGAERLEPLCSGDPLWLASLVFGVLWAALTQALSLLPPESVPPADQDTNGDGIGEAYARTYDLVNNTALDPDQDEALTLTEYQWDTIPVEHVGGVPVDGNATDEEGDAWMDGPEITYWSALIERVIQGDVQGARSALARTLEQEAASVDPPSTEPPSEVDDARPETGPDEWPEVDPDDRPEVDLDEVIRTLNKETNLAWRHPGLVLDTDGDGYRNVWDPDSDGDSLLDGYTLRVDEDDPRAACYTGQGDDQGDACELYQPHTLHHTVHDAEDVDRYTFPGELSLGSYPQFNDSDCLATHPGASMPIRCPPPEAMDASSQPGHGDMLTDAEEYAYWRSLLDDPEYTEAYPDVTEPWNTSYDADPVNNALRDADSDNDGLLDSEEILGCRIESGANCEPGATATLPWRADTDGDGLTDREEDQLGTDAHRWDTDGDGLPDGWEAWYGLNPFLDDASEDPDGDGASNLEEYCRFDVAACTAGPGVDWCGPNPRLADTDDDGEADPDQGSVAYDCMAPTRIVDASSTREPWESSGEDLGTLDPDSDHWINTGQTAERAATDPAGFTRGAIADPVGIARRIQENATQDAETVTRLVLPPQVHDAVWAPPNVAPVRIEALPRCPLPSLIASDPGDPPNDVGEAAATGFDEIEHAQGLAETVQQDPDGVVDNRVTQANETAGCAVQAVESGVDTLEAIAAEPLAFTQQLPPSSRLRNAIQSPIELPEASQVLSLEPLERQVQRIQQPVMDTVNETIGGLPVSLVGTTAQSPWDLLALPDRFPNLVHDVVSGDRMPSWPNLYEELRHLDDQAGSVSTVRTGDATHWDLAITHPDGTSAVVQNLPVGVPRPVWIDRQCSDPAEPNPFATPACAGSTAWPDLLVQLAPESPGAQGYSLSVRTLVPSPSQPEPLSLRLMGLVQHPGQDQVLALGLDGRPQAGEITGRNTTAGPLPTIATVGIGVQDGGDGLEASLSHGGADGALTLLAGSFAVDLDQGDKQPQIPEPNTEAAMHLDPVPESLTVTASTTHHDPSTTRRLAWTASEPTWATGILTDTRGGETRTVIADVEQLPLQGEMTLTTSPDSFGLTSTYQGEQPDRYDLRAWRAPTGESDPETVIDLSLARPASTLTLQGARTATSARLELTGAGPTEHLQLSRLSSDDDCPVATTPNRVALRASCMHVELHGAERISLGVDADGLTTSWRRAGTSALGIDVQDGPSTLRATVEPWPTRGDASLSATDRGRLDWSLSSPIDRFDLDLAHGDVLHSKLRIDGLPVGGSVIADPNRNVFEVDLGDEVIDRITGTLSTHGVRAPNAPGDDVVLRAGPSSEGTTPFGVHVALRELGTTSLAFDPASSQIDIRASPARPVTVDVEGETAWAHVHVDPMPSHLVGRIHRVDETFTIDWRQDPAEDTRPTIQAHGSLMDHAFELLLDELPESANGSFDASTGYARLQASEPLTIEASLAGNVTSASPVVPVGAELPGVSLALDQAASASPGMHIYLPGLTDLRFVPPDHEAPAPLVLEASLDGGGSLHASAFTPERHIYADVSGVPATAETRLTMSEQAGELHYTASDPLERILLVDRPIDGAPDGDHTVLWARDVPETIQATLERDETVALGLRHDAVATTPSVSFYRTTSQADGTTKLAYLNATGIPGRLDLTYDGQDITLETDQPIQEVVAAVGERLEAPAVPMHAPGTHGIHVATTAAGDRTVTARLGGLADANLALPGPTRSTIQADVTLAEARSANITIDDALQARTTRMGADRLGGGPVHIGATLEGESLRIGADLATGPGTLAISHQGPEGWLEGTLETQATELDATAGSTTALTANAPMGITLRGGPAQADIEPPGGTEGSYIAVEPVGERYAVNLSLAGITSFRLPDEPGLAMTWEADQPQPLYGSFPAGATDVRRLTLKDLPACCSLNLNAADGIHGELNLASATIGKLRLDAVHTAEETTTVNATIHGLPSSTLTLDERFSYEASQGLGKIQLQAARSGHPGQRLDALSERHGLVLDHTGDTAHAWAGGVNLTGLQAASIALGQGEAGGIHAEGDLVLQENLASPFFIDLRYADAVLQANASNLPSRTTVDLQAATQAQGRPAEASLTLDWTESAAAIETLDGTYVHHASDPEQPGNAAQFHVQDAEAIQLSGHAPMDGIVRGGFGGTLSEAGVRLDLPSHRLLVDLEGLSQARYAFEGDLSSMSGSLTANQGIAERIGFHFMDPDGGRLGPFEGDGITILQDEGKPEILAEVTELQRVAWSLGEGGQGGQAGQGLEVEFSANSHEPVTLRYEDQDQIFATRLVQLPDWVRFDYTPGPNASLLIDPSEPLDLPWLAYWRSAPSALGFTDLEGRASELSLHIDNTTGLNSTRLGLIPRGDGNASGVEVSTNGIQALRASATYRTEEDAAGTGHHILLGLDGVPATSFDVTQGSQSASGQLASNTREAIERLRASITTPVEQEPAEVEWLDAGMDHARVQDLAGEGARIDGARRVQLNIHDLRRLVIDTSQAASACEGCHPAGIILERTTPGHSFWAALDADMGGMHVKGNISVAESPEKLLLRTGYLAGPGGGDGGLEALAFQSRSSGAAKDIELDIELGPEGITAGSERSGGDDPENQGLDTPERRLAGTIRSLPANVDFAFRRDTTEPTELLPTCGFDWAERIPGELTLRASDPGEAFEGVDLSFGGSELTRLDPNGSSNFLGLALGDSAPSARLVLEGGSNLSIGADPIRGDGALAITVDLGQRQDIDALLVDTQGTKTHSDDTIASLEIQRAQWPASFTCHGPRLQLAPGDPWAPTTGQLADYILLEGQGLDVLGYRTRALSLEVTDLNGPLTIDTQRVDNMLEPVPDTTGVRVAGGSVDRIDLQARIRPAEDTDDCADASSERSSVSPAPGIVDVDWTLEARRITVQISEEDEVVDLPDPWVSYVRAFLTCERPEILAKLGSVDEIHLTQFAHNSTAIMSTKLSHAQPFVLQLKHPDVQEGKLMRLEIDPLDRRFRMQVEPAELLWRESDFREFHLTHDRWIKKVALSLEGCSLIVLKRLPPAPEGETHGAVTSGHVVNGLECWLGDQAEPLAESIVSFSTTAADEVGSVVYEVADRTQGGITFLASKVAGGLGIEWDADGHSGERDRRRGIDITGAAEALVFGATDGTRHLSADFDGFWQGPVAFDLTGFWWARPQGSPSESALEDSIEMPSSVNHRKCLWEGDDGCVQRETPEQVRRRLADLLYGRIWFTEESSRTPPWGQWREVVS